MPLVHSNSLNKIRSNFSITIVGKYVSKCIQFAPIRDPKYKLFGFVGLDTIECHLFKQRRVVKAEVPTTLVGGFLSIMGVSLDYVIMWVLGSKYHSLKDCFIGKFDKVWMQLLFLRQLIHVTWNENNPPFELFDKVRQFGCQFFVVVQS